MTQQPQPDGIRIREEILAALSDAGAFCGACGFEPGEIGCADCVRVRELYADALTPITDRLRAELEQVQQQTATRIATEIRQYCPDHGDADTCRIDCHCEIADEITRLYTAPAAVSGA